MNDGHQGNLTREEDEGDVAEKYHEEDAAKENTWQAFFALDVGKN